MAIAVLAVLFTVGFEQIHASPEPDDEVMVAFEHGDAKAIPDWVGTTMSFYLNKQISEREMLDAFNWMFNNNVMHLSQEAAQKVAELREENMALKKKLSTDGMVGPKTSPSMPAHTPEWTNPKDSDPGATSTEALSHLRKAYDLNPNMQTKVVQYDKEHDKWIDVLSIDWGSTADGDPDKPIVVGRIYSEKSAADMTLKGSKIKENYVDTTRQTPKTDFGSVFKAGFAKTASDKVKSLVDKADSSTTSWKKVFSDIKSADKTPTDFPLYDSVTLKRSLDEMCDVAIDKQIQRNETDLEFLKELAKAVEEDSAKTRTSASTANMAVSGGTVMNVYKQLAIDRAEKLEDKVMSLQAGMTVCEAELKNLEGQLQSVGEDAQLANIDLQNMLQKQQQAFQMLSSILKSQHDTAMSIIRNMKA